MSARTSRGDAGGPATAPLRRSRISEHRPERKSCPTDGTRFQDLATAHKHLTLTFFQVGCPPSRIGPTLGPVRDRDTGRTTRAGTGFDTGFGYPSARPIRARMA